MTAWLISLAVTLAISLASLVPGALDARLGEDLTRAARADLEPTATATVHVEGDPVLQLPWGVVPHMVVHLHGLHARTFPLEEVRVTLDHVHVSPLVMLAHQPPKLLEPVAAQVAVRLGRKDLQMVLERALARLTPDTFAIDLPLLGHIAPQIQTARVRLADGRVYVEGTMAMRPGAQPRAFAASVALEVEGGRHLLATQPQLSLGGTGVPSFLLGNLAKRIPPLLDLAALPLPPGDWTLQAPAIDADGLELRAAGTVTALPGPEGPNPGVHKPAVAR